MKKGVDAIIHFFSPFALNRNKSFSFPTLGLLVFFKSTNQNMLFVILACIFYPHLVASQPIDCNFFNNQDIIGHDIGSPQAATSAAQCCYICDQDPSCLAVVFFNSTCFKKNASGPLTPSTNGASTAIEQYRDCNFQSNTDIIDNDIQPPMAATSSAQCCKYCDQDPKCLAVVFWQIAGFCYKKSAQKPLTTSKDGKSTSIAAPPTPSPGPTAPPDACLLIPNFDIIGFDIDSPINADSPDQCCELCYNDTACLAVVFSELQCFKKNASGPLSPSQLPHLGAATSVMSQRTPTPVPFTPTPPRTPAPPGPTPAPPLCNHSQSCYTCGDLSYCQWCDGVCQSATYPVCSTPCEACSGVCIWTIVGAVAVLLMLIGYCLHRRGMRDGRRDALQTQSAMSYGTQFGF